MILKRYYSPSIPLITHFYSSLLLCFRVSGLRDALNFLLEEDLCNINLCSLHCDMRNCEQLLGSLGLFAHRVLRLDKLKKALSNYGTGARSSKAPKFFGRISGDIILFFITTAARGTKLCS